MRKFHNLQVKEVIQETPDAVSVTFGVPEDIQDIFVYTQGQHLTLRKEIEGEDLRRSYSICTSVAEKKVKVAIRKVVDGRFSGYANSSLKEGDHLEVMSPAGHFYVDLDEKESRTFVGFAGGAGITPVISIIKTTLETEPNSNFMLFYGNRSRQSTIFREEISFLKNKYMGRFSFWHFWDEEEMEIEFFKGPITEDKVGRLLETVIDIKKVAHTFVCGPEPMMNTIEGVLEKAGVSPAQVHSERFLSEGQGPAKLPKKDHKAAEGIVSEVTIVLDGYEQKVRVDGLKPILDSAIDAGLDVPFACKGGVCCTCRAKVIEGEVSMVLNQGLEPEEVEAGYVLTCQSFPVSETVKLSYDE